MFVQQLGANQAMSILLTSSSNVAAVFTMPQIVSLLLASSKAQISLDAWAMVLRLMKAVLLPLLVGASLRSAAQVRFTRVRSAPHCMQARHSCTVVMHCRERMLQHWDRTAASLLSSEMSSCRTGLLDGTGTANINSSQRSIGRR